MTATAKLFRHGGSQAVRLPKEFRMPGTEVRVSRDGNKVVLEPIDAKFDVDAWYAAIDAAGGRDFDIDLPVDAPVQPDPSIDFDKLT
ncbi:MAG: AbrB/MazE/SpoVT family DNA-binding domain-containing protein [Beijerinckiaceae bacterium]|nr:AbrB/MazE/SpoVT family DNA-binding domain-containing protein [Beijerinckiaceae bacterium]